MTTDPRDENEETPPRKEEEDAELAEDEASRQFFGDPLKNVVSKDLHGGATKKSFPQESPSVQFFGESLEEPLESVDEPSEQVEDSDAEEQ